MIEAQRQAFPGILDCIQLERNFGFSRATNEGITAAQTQFIPLLNNDTEADPTGSKPVSMLLKTSTDSPFLLQRSLIFTIAISLTVREIVTAKPAFPIRRGYGESVEEFSQTQPVLGASAAAAFYLPTLFEDIGFFDEDFVIYLEAVDLNLRAQLLGHRCLYLPDAIVYHMEAASDPNTGLQTNRPQTAALLLSGSGALDHAQPLAANGHLSPSSPSALDPL